MLSILYPFTFDVSFQSGNNMLKGKKITAIFISCFLATGIHCYRGMHHFFNSFMYRLVGSRGQIGGSKFGVFRIMTHLII